MIPEVGRFKAKLAGVSQCTPAEWGARFARLEKSIRRALPIALIDAQCNAQSIA